MPKDPASETPKAEGQVAPQEPPPADEGVHTQLARHGFLVSDDVDDPESADALARTMLSVIESMLASGPANEQADAADGDDTAGLPSSKSSPSS